VSLEPPATYERRQWQTLSASLRNKSHSICGRHSFDPDQTLVGVNVSCLGKAHAAAEPQMQAVWQE